VGAEDNWRRRNNFQEDPAPVIAHRTSPTNIGLLFLATAAAHDLGYVGSLEFLERLEFDFCDSQEIGKVSRSFFQLVRTQRASIHFTHSTSPP